MAEHVVQEGEYLTLIAKKHGVPWKKIWDDGANRSLRDRRKTHHMLCPGDRIVIPELSTKQEDGATEQRHRFRVKTTMNTIRIVLKDEFDKPIADARYRLSVRGCEDVTGTTGSDGLVEAKVPIDARTAQLAIDETDLVYTIDIGALDPSARITGVQQRLRNLGFDCGRVDGDPAEKTGDALLRFQQWAGLELTGVADKKTREALEKAHADGSYYDQSEDADGTSAEATVREPPPAPQTRDGPLDTTPLDIDGEEG